MVRLPELCWDEQMLQVHAGMSAVFARLHVCACQLWLVLAVCFFCVEHTWAGSSAPEKDEN